MSRKQKRQKSLRDFAAPRNDSTLLTELSINPKILIQYLYDVSLYCESKNFTNFL